MVKKYKTIKREKGTMGKFVLENNPYTLQFSYIPPQFIERITVTDEIISNFTRKVPTYRGMFITGIRGSGKTVLMGDIRNKIGKKRDWITVDINPESDVLKSLASSLYLIPSIKALFIKAKLDFSILGIGFSIENASNVASNEEDAVKLMLDVLKAEKKKVLITIDEVTYNRDISRFSHAMSSYANAGYDIYVLMTGLVENIKKIKNDKSLTFLYRAKIEELDRLNLLAISNDYKRTFDIDEKISDQLARESKGYSLAFQALGYHYWNDICKNGSANIDNIRDELYATLAELSYDKIWDELSEGDKKVMRAICNMISNNVTKIKIEELRNVLGDSSNTFNTYRKRLIEKGIIDGTQHGYVELVLPGFERFVKIQD